MEFSIRRVNALFKKELKDIGKNVNVLSMCVLPIAICIIYSKVFGGNTIEGLNKGAILILCLGANISMITSFVVAMLIAEEKEKNTLRTLMLSSVSPLEFLVGKAIITLLIIEVIDIIMFFIVGMDVQYLGKVMLITTLVAISMIGIGGVIGMFSPNQMATGVVGMPVIMIFFFIPMLAKLNETLAKISEILPNYHMNLLLEKVFKGETIGTESVYSILAILAWIAISVLAFAFIYSKRGLDK
jgi:ABC-2 type transport system permease protein